MFCAYTRPSYQVSVYRTIDPLVLLTVTLRGVSYMHCLLSLISFIEIEHIVFLIGLLYLGGSLFSK